MADEDRVALLDEAYKRNLLPPDMKSLYEEGKKRGIVGKAPGILERMATGFMDPVYGSAQVGSRMTPEGYMPGVSEDYEPYQKELQSQVDQTVRKREADYQTRRGPDAGIDWARGAGTMLNPLEYVPMALGGVPGALVSGFQSGLTTPATGPDVESEKMGSAALGTAIGGTLGVAAKGVSSGVRSLGAYLAREYPENVMTQSVQKILKRLSQDEKAGGPSAKDAIDLINEASAKGKPMTLADVGGENTRALAGNVARQPGESRNIATQFLNQRDEGAASRLQGDIAKYVSGGPSMHKTTEALLSARSAASRPIYDEMRAMEGIWSPRLQEFIDEPLVRRGMARGYEIERLQALAENRPFNPTQLGIDLDADGNVKLIKIPNMRVLDMGKQGLDAMIADERNELTGRLSSRGVALERVRQSYLGEIDLMDQNGVYRRARETWAGPTKSLDSVRAGRGVFQNSPEQNAADFAKLSPGDREFYRVGVADVLRERLAKTGLSGDEAKSLVKNPWVRDQLKPAFPTPESFNAFVDAVTKESKMFGTKYSTLGGSQTAARLAEDESGENLLTAGGAKIAENMASGSWLSAAKNAIRLWRDLGIQPNPKVNEQISRILFSTPIDAEGEVAQRLTGRYKGAPAVNRLAPAANVISQGGGGATPGVTALGAGPLAPAGP